jgi:hypothetical protein
MPNKLSRPPWLIRKEQKVNGPEIKAFGPLQNHRLGDLQQGRRR